MITYTPTPTCERFMLSDARMRVLCGPVGSGKSVCAGPMEILHRASQQEPGPDGIRRTRWAVVRNSLPMLRSTTLKTWLEWLPNGDAGPGWHETHKTFYLRMGDVEAEIMFRPLDDANDVANLLSLELTGAWFNECREIRPVIIENMSKRHGRYPSERTGVMPTWHGMWGDTNMPQIGTWWHQMMEEVLPNEWAVFRQPGGRSEHAENLQHLPEGYYDTEGLSEDYIRVYIDAEYGMALEGEAVWPMFSAKHVSSAILQPNPHLPLIIGADAGLTPAVVLMQLNKFGQIEVMDELVFVGGTDRFIKLKVLPLVRTRYRHCEIVVVVDPAAGSRTETDEKTVAAVWRKHGFEVKIAPSNRLPPRLSAVESALMLETELGPGIILSPACPLLRQAMGGGYAFALNRKGVRAETPDKSHPFSDLADSLQYGVLWLQKGHGRGRRFGEHKEFDREWRPADRVMGY